VSEASDFIEVGGQLIRESSITRLSSNSAAGVEIPRYHVHVSDGGVVSVSEVEYRRLKTRFEAKPPKSRKKTA
jgi:hypothetical protein